jgi:hypothetical protein
MGFIRHFILVHALLYFCSFLAMFHPLSTATSVRIVYKHATTLRYTLILDLTRRFGYGFTCYFKIFSLY